MGGMEDLVKSSIEIFLEYYHENLLKIKTAIDIKNIENIKRSAHSLKGSALNAGASAAAATLEKMETIETHDGSLPEAARLFIELEKNIADYGEEVKKQGLV